MNILFIGCGLIGGSIAKALIGKATIYTLTTKLIIYEGITSFVNEYDVPRVGFDIICIATPRGKNFEIYEKAFEIAGKFSSSATHIVDISSVQNQNEIFQKKYPNFTPCHPIAGTEKTGFENANPEIIHGKNCIIIGENSPQEIVNFWHNAGMKTVFLPSVHKHDKIFAKISHLPQLISFNIEQQNHSDFYRLCTSPLEIWRETFLHNKFYIQTALSEFQEELSHFNNTNFCLEKIISNVFVNFTDSEEKSFAGSGFRSITSGITLESIANNQYQDVVEIATKCQMFLANL